MSAAATIVGCGPRLQRLPVRSASPASRETHVTSLRWSPDGQHLACFATDGGYQLLLVDTRSGATVVAARGSDDLFFQTGVWRALRGDFCYIALEPTLAGVKRFVRSVDSTGRVLYSAELPMPFDSRGFAWDPPSHTLVLADSSRSPGSYIRVFGENLALRDQFEVAFHVWGLQWHPSRPGHVVVLSRRRDGGHWRDHLSDMDLSTHVVTDLLINGHIEPGEWTFAPSGNVYYAYAGRELQASVVGYNTISRQTSVVVSKTALPDLRVRQTDFQKGGERAALVSKGSVYVVGLPAGKPARVTDGPDDSWPALSPDGRQLAFVRGGTQVWAQDLATGGRRMVFSSPPATPDASRDGQP